jgi:hypothetical protein
VAAAPQGQVLWQLLSLSLADRCQSRACGGAECVYVCDAVAHRCGYHSMCGTLPAMRVGWVFAMG